MRINFHKFPCYTGISKKTLIETDIAESLADAIYKNMPGIAASALAHKIYTAAGEADYDDRDIEIIRNATKMFTGIYADSINDYIDRCNDTCETSNR